LEHEKLQIAKRHILPKILEEYGMSNLGIQFEDSAINKIIREYTREAGVRNLERELTSILRKMAKELVHDYLSSSPRQQKKNAKAADIEILGNDKGFTSFIKRKKIRIDDTIIEKYLKAPKFKDTRKELNDKIGVVTGLAWTSVGGDIMPLEVTSMPSNGTKLTLTGQLGDVMKESATAALSFIRSNYSELGLAENFNKDKEIHIHIPEGAIPKDGPSAGITMAIAMLSVFTNKPVKGNLAMTGEITLRGNILPIGGLKEKLLAAKRNGYKTVIVPFDNKPDVSDIEKEITDGLEIIYAKHINDILQTVFVQKNNLIVKSPKIHKK
jgi:ATP-dependent Lon protease